MSTDNKPVKDYLLSKEKVKSGIYDPSEIFQVKSGKKELGPFWQEDLKDFIQDYSLMDNNVFVKSLTDDDWKSVLSHPLFQRRKPEIVKEFCANNEEFYILRNTKKLGPFSADEVNDKLDTLEFLFTDIVSVDQGQSWGTIFEFEIFNRRNRTNEHLPELPNGHVFKNSILDADKALARSNKKSDKEFVFDLAYIGNQKHGKSTGLIDDFKQSDSKSNSMFIRLGAMAMSFLLVTGVFFSYQKLSTPSEREYVETKKSINKEKRVRSNRKPANKNSEVKAAPKRKRPMPQRRKVSKASQPIKKAPFLAKKKQMDNGRMEARDLPPEVIFDDNTEALELDPIRERITKETFDPQDELDDYDAQDAAQEIVDDYLDRSPASGEFSPEDAVERDEY